MQASLSSTASGRTFRTEPFTAVLPCFSAENTFGSTGPVVGRDTQSLASSTLAEGAGLAHDAGNLLGALGLYCDLLALPGVLQTEHRHYAEELRLLSMRSQQLIERLLDPGTTSRMAGRQRAGEPCERVVVPDVIESSRGVLNAVARRAVAVAYQVGAALPVAVPRETLERILVNLTKNAAEALPERSDPEDGAAITLRVTCDRAGTALERIVLSIEDRGRGMSAATVKVLLGESGTGPAMQRRGIGFQVVRELVGASGGQLRLTSQIGGGTTVSIAWAVASEPHAATHAATAEALERRLMGIARNGRAGRLSC
jgi:signal transduction histidine kinase